MSNISVDEGRIKETFCSIGQDQVFRFWKELNEKEREHLLKPLRTVSAEECQNVWSDMQNNAAPIENPQPPKFTSAKNPFCPSLKKFRDIGDELISHGKVAAFTVAGGQGTRLGHNGPKGTYPCTPIRQLSLFGHFAESIKFYSKHFGQKLWWFIMTSEENHQETQKFFTEMNFFGLERQKVKIFKQGMMPVFDLNGKILLKEKHQILMSPNGHGGSFRALHDSGSLKIMEQEGIDYISYFQVDNPMVYCLDPAFIGLHKWQKSEMSSKAVQKITANEKVGTFIKLNDQLHVIEYSDIPTELSEEKNTDKSLRFRLGSIAIHLLNRSFIQEFGGEKKQNKPRLCYHGALKPVRHIDENGNYVEAKNPNALKAETFVFDALPLAKNPLIMEIDREEEFAPIKNAHGVDSLESSHRLQQSRAHKWLNSVNHHTTCEKVEITSSFAPTWPCFVKRMSNEENLKIKFPCNQNLLLDELDNHLSIN